MTRRPRPPRRLAAALALAGACAGPAPAQPLAADASLQSRASRCELAAVADVVALVRTSDPATLALPLEAIRIAAGRCTRFVLALAQPAEVRLFCAAPASLTAVQTARELRRRMAGIEADELLRGSAVGQACRAAYEHELKTTRVVLRERR